MLVNGKAVTSADLTAEITSDFRSAGHRKQERRTNHDWHGGLANYLIARIKNPKPETPRNGLPGGQNDTSKPHPLAFTEENRPKHGPYALFAGAEENPDDRRGQGKGRATASSGVRRHGMSESIELSWKPCRTR